MFINKKDSLKKNVKKKFVYKFKYNANFLSKEKKKFNNVNLFVSNFLFNKDKLPVRNQNTGKFVFSNKQIGSILYRTNNNNFLLKKLNSGVLSWINKNEIWNPKLSKFLIKTKSVIKFNDKNKQQKIAHIIYLRKVFSELKNLLAEDIENKNLVDSKKSKSIEYLKLKLLKQLKDREQLYFRLLQQRVKKFVKKNKAKNDVVFEKQKEFLRKRINVDKKKYKDNFLALVKQSQDLNNVKYFKLTIGQMMASSVYLGSNSAYMNSAVKPFLLGRRNGFYIINLSFTYLQFRVLINFIVNIVSLRRKILIVKENDVFNMNLLLNYSNIFYCDNKWIGGSLTNHRVVRLCDKFKQRNYSLNSLLKMKYIPSLLFLFDPNVSFSALYEGFNLKIPISGIVNTNCSFLESINYPVVGNNDSFESVYLYMNVIKNAVMLGVQKEYRKVLKII